MEKANGSNHPRHKTSMNVQFRWGLLINNQKQIREDSTPTLSVDRSSNHIIVFMLLNSWRSLIPYNQRITMPRIICILGMQEELSCILIQSLKQSGKDGNTCYMILVDTYRISLMIVKVTFLFLLYEFFYYIFLRFDDWNFIPESTNTSPSL